MNPLIVPAAAGLVGGLLVYHETAANAQPVAKTLGASDLDPELDSTLKQATLLVIQNETNDAKDTFAQALTQAGYPKSAAVVAASKK